LTNPKTTELEKLRAIFWARNVQRVSGFSNLKTLEKRVREILRFPANEAGGSLKAHLKGRRPFKSRGPVPHDALWVDRIGKIWPETLPWFYTPFWFLLEPRDITPSELMACVCSLPRHFRDSLIAAESAQEMPAGLRLRSVVWPSLLKFSSPEGPWALGAMACAMRRAEMGGDVQAARLSAVGLVWLIQRQIAGLPPELGELLETPSDILEKRIALPGYFDFLAVPLDANGLLNFEQSRSSYLLEIEKLTGDL